MRVLLTMLNNKLFAALLLALACSGVAQAQARPLIEDQDYRVLKSQQTPEEPGKIEVIEFFSYKCPHCASFDPLLNAWIKKLPADVVVRRVPVGVAFRPEFAPVQRLYYALEALGLEETLHSKVFDAIHKEHVELLSTEDMTAFMAKQGVSKEKFLAAYNAFGVQARIRRADAMLPAYLIRNVPTLAVDGRYIVIANSLEGMISTADALVGKVREQKGLSKPAAPGKK